MAKKPAALTAGLVARKGEARPASAEPRRGVSTIVEAGARMALTQIENFMTALDIYFVDTGAFPTNQQGLQALRAKPDGVNDWAGPYLKKEIPVDPWGSVYMYRSPGRNGGYEIVSLGSDGQEGGVGDGRDIASWESAE